MSAEIKSNVAGMTMDVEANVYGLTYFAIRSVGAGVRGINVPTADLLAAIEAEGIGIVVPGVLPEVTVEGEGGFQRAHAGTHWVSREWIGDARETYRSEVLARIALLRWLDANPPTPPVNEADVEALVNEIRVDSNWGLNGSQMLARRLLASGRVTVTPKAGS